MIEGSEGVVLRGPGTLQRGGCPLHFWTAGPPSAPAVVLTHGVLMDHGLFAPQLPALARRYRVILWDVRGHGRSRPLGTEGFSISGAAADLAAILDALEIERAAFVGHSMGGYIVQELAWRSPERLLAAVMVSTTCLTDRQPLYLRAGVPLSIVGFRLCPDPILRGLVAFGAGDGRDVRRYASRAASVVSKGDFDRIWPGIVRSYHREPGFRLPCPLLLADGSRDLRVGFGTIRLLTRRWAARAPEARHVVIPAAGHNASQENAPFFTRELMTFLGEHLSGVSPPAHAGDSA